MKQVIARKGDTLQPVRYPQLTDDTCQVLQSHGLCKCAGATDVSHFWMARKPYVFVIGRTEAFDCPGCQILTAKIIASKLLGVETQRKSKPREACV